MGGNLDETVKDLNAKNSGKNYWNEYGRTGQAIVAGDVNMMKGDLERLQSLLLRRKALSRTARSSRLDHRLKSLTVVMVLNYLFKHVQPS